MLTKLVEKQTPESMCQHLADVMPGLLKVIVNKLVIQVTRTNAHQFVLKDCEK